MQTKFRFEAIGTHWQIDIDDSLSSKVQVKTKNDILSLIEDFDKIYSRFRKDSLITKISKQKGTYNFPKNANKIFSLYQDFYHITRHKFTPLIGQVLADAGYDATYSLKPKNLHKPKNWDEVIDFNKGVLTVKKPVLLDFGAAGKGYLIDLVCNLLKKNSVNNFCIDAGGDIFYQTKNNKPLQVGLEHPSNPNEVIGIAKICNQSICASSGNRRKWANFHHIIDPQTLRSPSIVKSTWVVADTAMIADALATCLFFVSPKILLDQFTFSYAIIYHDLTMNISKDFPAEIFTTANYEYSNT